MPMRRLLLLVLLPTAAFADDAVIEGATASRSDATWTFEVTLSHTDSGWDDYADGWRIVTEDGTELGARVLLHPHVDEQPFTRSLSGVAIPDGIATVYVEARTTRDGWGEARHPVALK
jgi:hypothetical protein